MHPQLWQVETGETELSLTSPHACWHEAGHQRHTFSTPVGKKPKSISVALAKSASCWQGGSSHRVLHGEAKAAGDVSFTFPKNRDVLAQTLRNCFVGIDHTNWKKHSKWYQGTGLEMLHGRAGRRRVGARGIGCRSPRWDTRFAQTGADS